MHWLRSGMPLVGLLVSCLLVPACAAGGSSATAESQSTTLAAPGELEELKGKLADLETEVEEAKQRASELQSAVETARATADDLESAISRFSYDDWQEVVPRVKSAAEDMSAALQNIDVQELSTALDDIDVPAAD